MATEDDDEDVPK